MLEGYISSAVMVMATTTIVAVSMEAPSRCALGACMYTVYALFGFLFTVWDMDFRQIPTAQNAVIYVAHKFKIYKTYLKSRF